MASYLEERAGAGAKTVSNATQDPAGTALNAVTQDAPRMGGDIADGVHNVGNDMANGVHSWGAGFADLNPFKKPNVATIAGPDPNAVKDVTFGGPGGAGGAPAKAASVTIPTAENSKYNPTTIQVQPGPTAATLQGLDNNSFRAAQLSAISQLQNQAAGVGPSIAAQQIKQAQDANTAQAYALANSARGGFNPAMARAALQAGATNNAQAAQQMAQARLQEQLQAAGVLGNIAGSARGQDIDISKTNAANQQQANIAGYQGGVQTAIAQGQLNADQAKTLFVAAQQAGITNAQLDQAFQDLQAKYAGMGLQAQMANQSAALELQKLIQSGQIAQAGLDMQANAQVAQMKGALIAGAGQAAAAAAGAPPAPKTTQTPS